MDVLYVSWISGVVSKNAYKACISSMAIGACGVLGVTSVINSRWAAIPYVLGLGAGTWLAIVLEVYKVRKTAKATLQ